MLHNNGELDNQPIHDWFELTYSSYLVLHRTLLQSMPPEWQREFVNLMVDLEGAFSHLRDLPREFRVNAIDNGKFIKDPYRDYQRGRRIIPTRKDD